MADQIIVQPSLFVPMESSNPAPTPLSSEIVYPTIAHLGRVLDELDRDGAHIDTHGMIWHPGYKESRVCVYSVRWIVLNLLTRYGVIVWSPLGDVAVLASRVK